MKALAVRAPSARGFVTQAKTTTMMLVVIQWLCRLLEKYSDVAVLFFRDTIFVSISQYLS
jgi:hypothetical protein